MVKISEIEKIRGRIRIRLDDGSEYMILKSMLRERPLEVNQNVDPSDFSRWVAEKQYRSALEKAVAMLADRPCSRGEIERKLLRIGYAPETVERVLAWLEEENLLDDRAFAEAWTRFRSARRYGPRRIALELRLKGVDEADTAAALETVSDEEQTKNAIAVARKAKARAKVGEDPRKTRRRITDALIRRGFGWEEAGAACDIVMGDK